MKAEVAGREGHVVTLKVEITPKEFEPAISTAYYELGKKAQVPGFRKGKVPREVIDTQFGQDTVYEEALRKSLGRYYAQAIIETGVAPVSEPSISIIESGVGKKLAFEAKVEVRPEVEIKDYEGIVVKKPSQEVTEEDLGRALDDMRDRSARLESAGSRPVIEGDFVLVDYKVLADGEPVGGSSASDRMLEMGKQEFLPGFDKQLIGAKMGDVIDVVVNFPPDYEVKELAGKPGTFRTLVKEIKKKVYPDLDEEFVKEVSEFDTLEELKEDLREKIAEHKSRLVRQKIKEQAMETMI